MEERRYVVEISRPLSPDLVATASDSIAGRLEMEAERIRTLLGGRIGAVTRPVLHEKALVIARVFGDAGVAVTVREVILEADPIGQPPTIIQEPEPEPAPHPTAHPVAEPTSPGPRPELDSIWDDDSGWDSEQEVVAPWNASDDDTEDDPQDDTYDDGSADADLTDDDDVDYSAYPSLTVVDDEPDAGFDDAAGPGPVVAGSGPSNPAPVARAEPEPEPAERTSAPQPWRRGEGAAVSNPSATLPSTRWVPSPHDQIEAEPAAPNGAAAARPFEAWEQSESGAKATGETGRWWVPERAVVPEPVAPEPEGPPLRNYLIWALLASVVVLLGLQVLFALRDQSGRPLDYQGGLDAYRQGDFSVARRAWESAAGNGDARAQFMLGHMVQNGQGQPWSNARAAEWYQLAAQQGLPEAQVALADLYLRGMGVPPEPQTAAQWLLAAARSGHADAQLAYGELLLHGQGVQRDFAQARAWFESAAELGSQRAVDMLEFIRAAGSLETSGQ